MNVIGVGFDDIIFRDVYHAEVLILILEVPRLECMEVALSGVGVAFVDDPLHGESGDPGGVVVGERDVVVVDSEKVSDNDTSENRVGVG